MMYVLQCTPTLEAKVVFVYQLSLLAYLFILKVKNIYNYVKRGQKDLQMRQKSVTVKEGEIPKEYEP